MNIESTLYHRQIQRLVESEAPSRDDSLPTKGYDIALRLKNGSVLLVDEDYQHGVLYPSVEQLVKSYRVAEALNALQIKYIIEHEAGKWDDRLPRNWNEMLFVLDSGMLLQATDDLQFGRVWGSVEDYLSIVDPAVIDDNDLLSRKRELLLRFQQHISNLNTEKLSASDLDSIDGALVAKQIDLKNSDNFLAMLAVVGEVVRDLASGSWTMREIKQHKNGRRQYEAEILLPNGSQISPRLIINEVISELEFRNDPMIMSLRERVETDVEIALMTDISQNKDQPKRKPFTMRFK